MLTILENKIICQKKVSRARIFNHILQKTVG